MSCDRWIAILRTNRSDGPHNTECCTIAFSFLCFKQRQRRRTLHSKILRKRIDIINFYQFFSLYKTKLIVCLTNTKEETKSFTHHTCTRSTKRIKGRDESVIYLKWCRRRRRIHQKPMTKPKNLPLHRNYSLSNFSTWILRKSSLSATVVRLLSKVLIAYWGSKSERKKSKQSKALNTTNDNQHRQMFLGEYTWSSNQKCDWLISHRTTPYSLWLRQMLQSFFFFSNFRYKHVPVPIVRLSTILTLWQSTTALYFSDVRHSRKRAEWPQRELKSKKTRIITCSPIHRNSSAHFQCRRLLRPNSKLLSGISQFPADNSISNNN